MVKVARKGVIVSSASDQQQSKLCCARGWCVTPGMGEGTSEGYSLPQDRRTFYVQQINHTTCIYTNNVKSAK